ncbi:MAG: bacteriocin [Parasporobacterium sp.]|nr:bacteriocin [Parasporobacterium sp.]
MSEETKKELSTEELQNVSGGGCGKKPDPKPTEPETREPETQPAPPIPVPPDPEDPV